MAASTSLAAEASRSPAGKLADGTAIEAITLSSVRAVSTAHRVEDGIRDGTLIGKQGHLYRHAMVYRLSVEL